jgi:tRNA pseudouridine55 synthase
MNGVIIVDKPAGWTSHDVVNRMRRILGQRAVGHLGTLDPLATGVLPLVTGSFTRLAQFYTASEKSYEGVIRFGFSTTTYDADGDPVPDSPLFRPEQVFSEGEDSRGGETLCSPAIKLDASQLHRLAAQFLGVIEQTPPPFSAKKIHGVPAYKLARKKKEVDLKPVKVEIKEFVITTVNDDCAHFRARVSSGTYMRSVAHELGQRLGCGAHLASLRRTAVAEFDINQARTLEEIETGAGGPAPLSAEKQVPHLGFAKVRNDKRLSNGSMKTTGSSSRELLFLFIHPRQLLPQFPAVTADEATIARIHHGRPVNLPELTRARHVKVFANQTDLIAIATRVAGSLFHPQIVFSAAES